MNLKMGKCIKVPQLLQMILFFSTVLCTGFFWFQNIHSQNLNMDEIAWVLDTDQYVQWRAGNGDFFRVVSGEKSWDDPKFRIVDQPFLGKAIFGWYLDNNKLLHAWSESKSKELYALFPKFLLPVNEPPEISKTVLSDEIVHAISVLRMMTGIVGFVVLVLFAGFMVYTRKSFVTGCIILILAGFHPLIRNNFRLVLPNVFEVGFSLLSIPILYKGFSAKGARGMQRICFIFFGSVLVALAADIKLSALSLLGIPLIITIVEKKLSVRFIQEMTFFLLVFYMTLWVVDPVVRMQPMTGLWDLAYARFSQQLRFMHSGHSIPFIYTPVFLIREIFTMSHIVISVLFYGLVVLGIVTLVKKKLWIVLIVCGYLLIINLCYLTAGFNRYTLNSLFVCIFLAGYSPWAMKRILHRYFGYKLFGMG